LFTLWFDEEAAIVGGESEVVAEVDWSVREVEDGVALQLQEEWFALWREVELPLLSRHLLQLA
jgi:hypothetical protein